MEQNFRCIWTKLFMAAGLFVLLAGSVDVAVGGEFRWPTVFTPGANPPLDPEHVLGRPDGYILQYLALEDVGTYHTFAEPESFDPATLASVLGVTQETIDAADFLAFEVWGAFFEYSTWTFSAGGLTLSVHAPDEVLATGMITTAAYKQLFGLPGPTDTSDMWNFILVDLDPISAFATDFAVQVVAGGGPQGSPDLESMGIMTTEVVAIEKSAWSSVKALYR